MKEMVYKSDRNAKREILYDGEYKGYKFEIVSLGTHPTAYVYLKESDIDYDKDYMDIDIDVHGGLTYKQGGKIGWDYSHYCDYYATPSGFELPSGRKWDTIEIYDDAKSVIEQVIAKHE